MLLKFKTQNRRESVPFLQPVEELPVYDLIVAWEPPVCMRR